MSMNWISHAVANHKGLLHRELGVKRGQKIPLSKLRRAANSKNPKLRRRARLAITLRSFKD